MEQIKINIKRIDLTNQNNGKHYLILIVGNDSRASMLDGLLNQRLKIQYTYAKPDIVTDIAIDLLDTQQRFNIILRLDALGDEIMKAIDLNAITAILVAYIQDQKVVPFGLLHALEV